MFYEFYGLFSFFMLLAIADFGDRKAKSLALVVSFLCLSLFASFRYDVSDYKNYVEIFFLIPNNINIFLAEAENIHGEYGYLILNFIIKYLGGSFLIVSVIVATSSVFLNLKVISKLSLFPILSVIFYFSHLFINKELILLRTGLASSIIIFGIYLFIKRKSYVLLLFSIFIASAFHMAALVALVLPVALRLKISNKILFLITLILFFCAAFNLYATNLVINLFNNLGLMPNNLTIYINYDAYNNEIGAFNLKTVLQLTTSCVLLHYRKFLKDKIIGFDVLLTTYLLSTIILLAFADFAIMAARLATMLSNVEFILLPSLVLLIRRVERVVPHLIIIGFSFIIMQLNFGPARLTGYENYIFDLLK